VRRHFTCTGFVVEGDKTLLLWHRRLQMWVPPGGHLEADEDPVSAVLREIREETGLEAEVLPLSQTYPFGYPGQIAPPYTILLEDSPHLLLPSGQQCLSAPTRGSCGNLGGRRRPA
jgi:ADP-ribose pyrophosphatase YjhB (NUDIX family)